MENNVYKEIYDGYPLLNAADEIELLKLAKAGSKEASDKLALCNLRLVGTAVYKYRNRDLTDEELMQEGIIGLMTALEKFEIGYENRFSTYATFWIENAIRSSLNSARLIKMSYKTRKRLQAIRKEILFNGKSDYNEIAATIGISVSELKVIMQFLDITLSLDVEYGRAEDRSLYDYITSTSSYDELLSKLTVEKILEDANLNKQELEVVKALFLNDIAASDYAQMVGLDRSRIYCVRKRALSKIKSVYR